MPESSELVSLTVNGVHLHIRPGTTVAAAVGIVASRTRGSVSGEARGPLCGMGICFECRVSIDGQPHQKSCQTLCVAGMDVRTT